MITGDCKHIRIRMAYAREGVDQHDFVVRYTKSEENVCIHLYEKQCTNVHLVKKLQAPTTKRC